MNFKSQKGITGIDVTVAVLVVTIFMTIIGSLLYNINASSKDIERRTEATYKAINIIEEIKSNGFAGLPNSDIIDQPIGQNTGYYKTVRIKDYADMKSGKTRDKVKKVTVIVSYNSKGQIQTVELSTIVANEE